MRILFLILPLFLTGCAGYQQAIDGGIAAGVVAIKAAEDTNIKVWIANACGTPLSAAIRHPEIVPALRELCIPSGEQSSPITLLEAKK